MRNIATIGTTIGTTLLALGIASTALAIEPPANDTPPQQGGQSGGQPGGKGDGKPSGKDGERPGRGNRPDFKTLDKNGDGFITQDEVPAEAWERMKKADKNGDGKISAEELREARPNRRGQGGSGGPGSSGGQGGSGSSGGGAPPAKQGNEPK